MNDSYMQNRFNWVLEELENLVRIEWLAHTICSVSPRCFRGQDFYAAKKRIISELLKEQLSYFIFAEPIDDLDISPKGWSQLSRLSWIVPPDIDLEEFNRSVLLHGGWLFFVGGNHLKESDLLHGAVCRPEGISFLLQKSGAELIIASIEDDVSWLIGTPQI